ncbi:aminotransferase class I/II-fold pyridoxal phosphate-dependent enzyme [Streptomyces sp. HSW2009]|uniref:aminotransferase class I/II-fold pyridoxal phosphate-dependent enzyme n=1 Tax=Streptomyces sp. HSW2009 TaxID=3142890 RepID=UPI0032EFF534
MSKTHWGGLRIGWLRAPARLVTELASERVASDMGGSVLDQLLALTLLARADELLPPRLEQLRQQRAALAAALAEQVPQWSWHQPPGGLSLWVDLAEPVASALAERALTHGVRIESGAVFAADPGIFEQRLRIPFTATAPQLQEAVRRLATALTAGLPSAPATRRTHWVA